MVLALENQFGPRIKSCRAYQKSKPSLATAQLLLTDLAPNGMRAPLPSSLRFAQDIAKAQLVAYYATQDSDSNANDI